MEAILLQEPYVGTCYDKAEGGGSMDLTETAVLLKQSRQAWVAHRKALAEALRQADAAIAYFDSVISAPVSVQHQGQPRVKRQRRSTVRPAVLAVLQESGEEMHADDVLMAVQNRGVLLSGENPKNTVVSALLRLAEEGIVEKVGKNLFRAIGGVTVLGAEPIAPSRIAVESDGAIERPSGELEDSGSATAPGELALSYG